jgi:hypothetical protein
MNSKSAIREFFGGSFPKFSPSIVSSKPSASTVQPLFRTPPFTFSRFEITFQRNESSSVY